MTLYSSKSQPVINSWEIIEQDPLLVSTGWDGFFFLGIWFDGCGLKLGIKIKNEKIRLRMKNGGIDTSKKYYRKLRMN